MYTKPSSPLPIGGVLDNGFLLYRYCLKETFIFAFLAALIAAPFNRMMQGSAAEPGSPSLVPFVASLAVLALTILLYTPIVAKVYAIQRGQHLTLLQALEVGVRRFPVILGIACLYFLAIVIGLVLLVIPGIYLMVALAFSFIIPVVEWKGVIDSLKYSRELVRGQWWRTAALVTIISIVVGVLYALYGVIVGVAVGFDVGGSLASGQLLPWYVDLIVNPLMAGFVGPLSYALFMAVYTDLKLRREGADIAERIAAAEA